jgi:tungstate transport system substrate-binding protein
VLASTTSVQDSGLLDDLIPRFEKDHPELRAKVVAVGSGEAIDLGRRGDADVLLVHSPKQEEEFMNEGLGTFRKKVMRNNFVIVGPAEDPAAVSRAADATDAFRRIATGQSAFVSRGDESGTHQKELQLWEKSGSEHTGGWYLESGQGMGETLAVAGQKAAYVLSDTASFKVMADRIPLKVLLEGDPFLTNPYSVIPVKSARHPSAALAIADWLTGERGQSAIRSFGVNLYGGRLFEPDISPE